ncbi:hypothetical protein [Nitrosomonas sp. Nm166]|uniref:hypothetical protein n=1 Tax=Nitrosomonas sp. Nm166 TaxID=1881054 RepID=UPI00116036D1|nr:hypothetical protein [Nitrosomonas sp. Nm166]
MNNKSFLNLNTGERTRKLLEDFDVIGTVQHLVLVPRGDYLEHLHENVRAAVIASTLGLSSIDYAKRRYGDFREEKSDSQSALHAYIDAYSCAKAYVNRMLEKLQSDGLPEPSLGVFGASIVLERLPPSFFCAHFLYQMGHRYEGHAVSRLILEQIAWAYAAYSFNDLKAIEKIDTTRCISLLKRFAKEAGRLYGFLSAKTHIDYASHSEFLRFENSTNVVLHAQPEFREYGQVILVLADLFGLVWELSQFNYIKYPEAIEQETEGPIIRADRPFLAEMQRHTDAIERSLSE